MKSLQVIQFRAFRKTAPFGESGVRRHLCEENYLSSGNLPVARGRFPKSLNFSDRKSGLVNRAVNVADAFSLYCLYIPVCDQFANCAADGIPGTIILLNQSVFRRK